MSKLANRSYKETHRILTFMCFVDAEAGGERDLSSFRLCVLSLRRLEPSNKLLNQCKQKFERLPPLLFWYTSLWIIKAMENLLLPHQKENMKAKERENASKRFPVPCCLVETFPELNSACVSLGWLFPLRFFLLLNKAKTLKIQFNFFYSMELSSKFVC